VPDGPRQQAVRSDEAQAWRLAKLGDFVSAAREWITESADVVVDTSAMTPAQAASQIAKALNGPALPARSGRHA
jgi:hypothetical protein